MLSSESSQHWVGMGLAWGLSRGCEETGAQGVTFGHTALYLSGPSQTIDFSFSACRAGPGMLHLAGFSQLLQSTPWELSLRRFRKLEFFRMKEQKRNSAVLECTSFWVSHCTTLKYKEHERPLRMESCYNEAFFRKCFGIKLICLLHCTVLILKTSNCIKSVFLCSSRSRLHIFGVWKRPTELHEHLCCKTVLCSQ